jgi:hypothetical protein
VLDYEPRKDIYESAGESMTSDDLQHCLDLRRADLDPELFAAAVTVHYIRRLIAAGGGSVERPDEEEALHPHPSRSLSRSRCRGGTKDQAL